MSNPSSKPEKQRPVRPKTAAQRASEANKAQQLAVRTNVSRPNDRSTAGEHDTLIRPKN